MKNPLKTLLGKPGPRQRGERFEQSAAAYLKKQGLVLLQANVHSRYGEIDLICEDGEYMVFVEVRYRDSSSHGTPLETVTRSKQQKIHRTAQHFLQKNGLTNRMPCRFDVVGITGDIGNLEFQWIRNAF